MPNFAARDSPSDFQKIAALEDELNQVRDVLFFQSTHSVGVPSIFGQGRRSSSFGSELGAKSQFPLETAVTEFLEDLTTATGVFDKLPIQSLANVVVGPVGTLIVKTIEFLTDGSVFSLTPGTGRTVELTPGGVSGTAGKPIDIPSTIVLTDQDIVYMQYFADTDRVKVISSSAGGTGGANKTLSNLTSPTAINQDLLFDALGYDIGNSTFPVDNLNVEQIRLRSGTITVNIPMITSVGGNSVDINFPTGSKCNFFEQGVLMGFFSGGELRTEKLMTVKQQLDLLDNSTFPTVNGFFSRDGDHVGVFSGGAMRNMSQIQNGYQEFETWESHETTQFDFEVYMANSMQGGNELNIFLTEDQIKYVPFFLSKRVKLARAGIEVVAVTSSFQMDFAIYDSYPDQNYPRTRLGLVSTPSSGTGTKTAFFSPNVTLEPGLYFLAFVSNNNDTLEVRAISEGHGNCCGYADEVASGFSQIMSYFQSTGVMPATAANDLGFSNTAPLIFAKFLPV